VSSAHVVYSPVAAQSHLAVFASDVNEGLSATQKELSSQYLYDEVGSALFDAITFLPEYGLTRADERVIHRCAPELARRLRGDVAIAELGSGSGRKTRHIVSEFSGRRHLAYFPIDVSTSALDRCRSELSPYCDVRPVFDTYIAGMSSVAERRRPGQRLLVLFLGSTIGNFTPAAARDFLTQIRRFLIPGDALLIGADLVKPVDQLITAYDDPAGVTAAFNRNLLCRINRELGGEFDLSKFRHEARYSRDEQRVEMHLRAMQRHSVVISALDREFQFRKGETIWTESSHKFRLEQLESMATDCGFVQAKTWTDAEWPFAECLWELET